jgi:hypothetical protein
VARAENADTFDGMTDSPAVIDWLLDAERSDPAIRWQVMRDLLDRPRSEWEAERARVETKGWGARLLALEDDDGQWAGGAHFPADFDWSGPETARGSDGRMAAQPWTATSHSLALLREFGLDPSSELARRAVELIGANARWEEGGQPYWEGETEPCINGTLVANGSYFGVDMSRVVERLVGERLDDGGWNCDVERGSTRTSFGTTINVLEGLLEYERATGGSRESREARRSGDEYLLERMLFRRLTTGEPADERFLLLVHPDRWRYSVIRGLDYFRSAALLTGAARDPRLGEAIDRVRSRYRADGTWPLDWTPPGRSWFDVDDGEGQPSRWITLRAMRVLKWWEG